MSARSRRLSLALEERRQRSSESAIAPRRFTIRKASTSKRPSSTCMKKGNLRAFDEGDRIDPNELLTMPCDVLVPSAVDRVINEKNAAKLKCRILAEGANGPTTPEADLILNKRWDEVFVIPDILCNAGGVIVSYFEWVQGLQAFMWSETEVTDKLFRILEHSLHAGDPAREERQDFASHGGDGDRGRARDEGEARARIIPVTRGDELFASAKQRRATAAARRSDRRRARPAPDRFAARRGTRQSGAQERRGEWTAFSIATTN